MGGDKFLIDAGAALRIRILGSFAVALSYGRDLRGGKSEFLQLSCSLRTSHVRLSVPGGSGTRSISSVSDTRGSSSTPVVFFIRVHSRSIRGPIRFFLCSYDKPFGPRMNANERE